MTTHNICFCGEIRKYLNIFFIVYASHLLIRLICIRGSHRCANVMKSTCTAAIGSKPSLCFSQGILLNRSTNAKAKIPDPGLCICGSVQQDCANAHDYTCICLHFRLRPDEPFLITWVNMQLTFITFTIFFSFFPENRL